MRKLNSGLFGRLQDPYDGCYQWWVAKKKHRAGIEKLIVRNDRTVPYTKSKKGTVKSYNRRNSFSGKRIYSKNKIRGRR